MDRLLLNLKHFLLPIAFLALMAGCSPEPQPERGAQEDQAWPSGLVAPIQGATFSLALSDFPGSAGDDDAAPHQGFDFLNGRSGRPLADNEPAVAVADGQIIRIDHAYAPPEANRQAYYAQIANESGFVGDYALDQLRGRQVWIRHKDGHISRYAHLSQVHPELQPGDAVEQGQVIGLMGNSGIPVSEEQPNPPRRLHFELWTAGGQSYLGQDLTPLETHLAVADIFSPNALPAYARRIVARVESGEVPPSEYPPKDRNTDGFSADVPASVSAGRAFAVSITWDDSELLEAEDLFADLDGRPLGILQVDGGALAIGAVPIDNQTGQMTLTLGGVGRFGQSLAGSRVIDVDEAAPAPPPLEIDASILARHTEKNQNQEHAQLSSAGEFSLRQRTPAWTKPFQPPLNGEIVGVFGQRLIHGMLRPQYPLPGVLLMPTEDLSVKASNSGTVALVADLPIRGSTVAVAHGGGIVSVYARLNEIGVAEGDKVQRGDPLGSLSQGDDPQDRVLLWEIHAAGTPTNPQDWLDRMLPPQ